MVLTQLGKMVKCCRNCVLFPYHYGSHATKSCSSWRELYSKFPYHYGSHATTMEERLPLSFRKVSIPLWFSRNMVRAQGWRPFHCPFPYHYGSYKSRPPLTVPDHGPVHRKDQRSDPEQELFRMTNWVGSYNLKSWLLRGSPSWRSQPCVPGWFSGHCVRRWSSAHHFPGWSSRHSVLPKAAIHTTMVLTQRQKTYRGVIRVYAFPYHYGSHATKERFVYTEKGDVSIPLWFSRNRPSRTHRWPKPAPFPYHYGSHATEIYVNDGNPNSEFPYHYGSHATSQKRQIALIPNLRFHTTMVLTQQK